MRAPRIALCGSLLAAALLCPASPALAAWNATGEGAGFAKARTMPAGNQPSTSVSNRSVSVSWSQSSFGDGTGVSGYMVKRYSSGGAPQTIGAGCSGTISGLSCTETAVPPGTWRYSVVPTQGAWTGAESTQSTAVTVAAPTLTLTPTSVVLLPATLTGTIDSFVPGQTVSFRLDDPSTGPVLSGSTTPSPVPASGSAAVTVTIPSGTSNGAHTVYAVGSSGDVASSAITVSTSPSIAFVKNVGQASCGTTSSTVTVPADGVAAGHMMVLRLMLRGSSSGAVGASDSRGNSYAADVDFTNIDQRIVVFSAPVGTTLSGGDTITVTHPNANSKGVVVDEFSGLASTGRVDATGSVGGNSTTPAVSVTTTNPNDLVIGAVSMANQQTVTQPGSPWNPLTGQSLSCGSASNFGAYRIVSSAGTYTYNPGASNGSRWAAAAVAYKAG